MIDEGTTAPEFELPALVDGDYRRVALEEYLGQDVVILAFYPADFNPACDVESDLDQLDLFTMQQDVSVLAVGPDTLFAHEAFAEEYDLAIPLLSDSKREAGEAYDVAYEDRLGQSLLARAVFVIDHDGSIVYAWSSRDPASRANVDEIKDALGDTGGDDTAFSRYRVGHAHYVEGRRAFTSAMDAYGNSDWMISQSDFKRAREEFEEAEGHFASAVRFVDTDLYEEHYDAAKEKATALWQAADWLGRSASEYSSGAGAAGKSIREDAERPLEEARAVAEPVDPDEWPPEEPPEREPIGEDDGPAYLVDDGSDEPAALGVDIDEDGEGDGAAGGPAADDQASGAPEDDNGADASDGQTGGAEAADGDSSGEGDIDDDELAEIEAEIAASGPDEPLDSDPPEERRSVVDETPAEAASADGTAEDAGQANDAGGSGEPATPAESEAPADSEPPEEPDLDAIEDDLAGGGPSNGASLEPEDGASGTLESQGDAGTADDAGFDDEDELEEIEPESTSLEGIPSEEELAAEAEAEDDGDETADAGE